MNKSKLLNLASLGYSVTPLTDKKPIIPAWQMKENTLSKNDIESIFNNDFVSVNGTRDDGSTYSYNSKFNQWGLVCGINDLEALDFDLKVFSELKERNEWWDEFISFCKDNIEDFDSKFVIQKTKNSGYHILYKCEKISGAAKIAKLKGHEAHVIESKGIRGQVVMYDNFVDDKSYTDIQYISVEDRDIIWSICKTYNYVEEIQQPTYIKEVKDYSSNSITPWEDYNNKTNIWDIIGDSFKIVRQLKDKTIIKRHGASSPHSGYVYGNSGCMYLFSTGTIYPHETLINPYTAYTYKYHNGDFKASASELYNQGFGTRNEKAIKEKAKEITEKIEVVRVDDKDLIFPIDIFPKPIQSYISDCHNTLNNSIDYMGCSLLWVISTCIGNSMQIEVKKGWKESANIWISLVGKAGIGKTPSINSMLFPLKKINNSEIKHYQKEHEKYTYYQSLSPKEQKEHEEVQQPIKRQFIANDITLEALIDLHKESDNSVGVFKDELAGWLKDMNKYRAGSDLEFWLSSWSGETVNVNRIQRGVSYINRPFIPVLGGIQPSILNNLSTEENKDNGFMDRLLLSYPDLKVDKYNDKDLDLDAYNWYDQAITSFYETINKTNKIIKRDSDGNIEPLVFNFSEEAKKEWIRIFDSITDTQNSDEENEYLKSMLPKQKTYIPRFALLLHVFNGFVDDVTTLDISKESVLKAEKLSNYFINMAKKIKLNNMENKVAKEVISNNKSKNKKEQFNELFKVNPKLNRVDTAVMLDVTKMTIHRWIKEIEKNE